MTLASVIIPCFNAHEWIRETLASVCAQNMDDIETIVVDDGSTDDSAGIVVRNFPWVHLIRTANGGPSRARNIGIRTARGEFIQFLDADDLLVSGKIKKQVEALQQTSADVVYGDWQYLRRQRNGLFTPEKAIARKIDGDAEIALFTNFWCPPAAYMFRRSIVEKVGGLNERLPIIQDARFALDCALYGARFVYCPGIMAQYRVHATDSVSRRNLIAFTRDCLQNAVEVEHWWQVHGGITTARRAALVQVYGQVARTSFENDPQTFESAYGSLEHLCPGYMPASPKHLALATRILGYRRAERLALVYRRSKAMLQSRRIT